MNKVYCAKCKTKHLTFANNVTPTMLEGHEPTNAPLYCESCFAIVANQKKVNYHDWNCQSCGTLFKSHLFVDFKDLEGNQLNRATSCSHCEEGAKQ